MKVTLSWSTSNRGSTPSSASSPIRREYHISRRGWRRPSQSSNPCLTPHPAIALLGAPLFDDSSIFIRHFERFGWRTCRRSPGLPLADLTPRVQSRLDGGNGAVV